MNQNKIIKIIKTNQNDNTEKEITIDNFVLCESIVASIIESYKVTGACICMQCDKQICADDAEFMEPSYDEILQHVMTHNEYDPISSLLQSNDFPELFICDQCQYECYSIEDYEQHINNHDYNDEDTQNQDDQRSDDQSDNQMNDNAYNDDEYNDDEYLLDDSEDDYDIDNNYEYKYNCPICNKGYDAYLEMKIHFVIRHIDYPDLGKLNIVKKNGFPGFELLNKIGMSRYLRNDEKIYDDTCVICCDKYEQCMISKTDHDITMNKRKKAIKYNHFIDDMRIMYLNHIEYEPKNPVKLLCCGAQFCSKCLKNHIESIRGRPECPFCKKDHTNTTLRYIIYDERSKEKKEKNPDPYPLVKPVKRNKNKNNNEN